MLTKLEDEGKSVAAVNSVVVVPGVQVVHDRTQASGVVAQGKIPVLVEIGGYPDVIKSVNVDNFATYMFLGAAKPSGYQFSYKVTANQCRWYRFKHSLWSAGYQRFCTYVDAFEHNCSLYRWGGPELRLKLNLVFLLQTRILTIVLP